MNLIEDQPVSHTLYCHTYIVNCTPTSRSSIEHATLIKQQSRHDRYWTSIQCTHGMIRSQSLVSSVSALSSISNEITLPVHQLNHFILVESVTKQRTSIFLQHLVAQHDEKSYLAFGLSIDWRRSRLHTILLRTLRDCNVLPVLWSFLLLFVVFIYCVSLRR